MRYEFEGKTILVTGGTSGIGKEIAKQLLLCGANLIINYGHSHKKLEQTQKDFAQYENRIMYFKADISKETEVMEMFKGIKQLDYLVNNAGINIDSSIENLKIEDFQQIIYTNLIGKVICTKHAIPLLRQSHSPAIVNIASRLGVKPCEGASAYCASEAGIINFTQASALELAKDSIRVNCISPSLTLTPLSQEGWSKEEIEKYKKENPLGRLGETIDIANTALFLLSDHASYITGENIGVNGGSLLV